MNAADDPEFLPPRSTGLLLADRRVAARAVLNERAPAEMQGRIFAAQMMLGSVASIVPLFIVGGLAELVSARIVIILVTLAVVAAAVFFSRLRVGPQAERLARTV